MKKVSPMQIEGGMTVDEIIREYKKAGVLGAGGLAKAADIFEEMIRKRATIFLGLSGPLMAAGLRGIITDLINSGYVSAVVTNGANVVHDMVESQKGSHYIGDFRVDDRELARKKIGRIGDIFTKEGDFENFEDRIQKILGDIDPDKRADVMLKAVDIMRKRLKELAKWESMDVGKPIYEAENVEYYFEDHGETKIFDDLSKLIKEKIQ